MAIRDKVRSNAAHLLQPGETIQAVIPCQNTSAYFALISVWIIVFKNAYRNIIVTDQRIMVCRSGRFRLSPVKDIERQGPRQTVIGPPQGLWYKTNALGETLYIGKRFHRDVNEADAFIQGGPPPQYS